MMRHLFSIILAWVSLSAYSADYVPKDYIWTTPSLNASESMPCGGHDIGMNVWVEKGDVLFYIAQSGWFDENNTLLKAGRWRLHFDDQTFDTKDFQQRLCLDEGAMYIKAGGTALRIWTDVFSPTVFVTLNSKKADQVTLSYESWRYQDRPLTKAECQQCSYKWVLPKDAKTFADKIEAKDGQLTFTHQNHQETVFDFTIRREHMEAVKSSLYNPIGGRKMQGVMQADGFQFIGTSKGQYASTDFQAWNFKHDKLKKATIAIQLSNGDQNQGDQNQGDWLNDRSVAKIRVPVPVILSKNRSAKWWHDFWQRSWIKTESTDPDLNRVLRNYELFRYMLGCNAYSQWPTKFNGGLFTFDPVYVDAASTFTPDYRKWGGGTMTAQNQRLVYWPMLKSGDTDMMAAQIDTYLRLQPNAEAWTRQHWGHEGACYSEQIENFGFPNPAEYGKHPEGSDFGTERNAWLEYEWDTVLEFCQMALLMNHGDWLNDRSVAKIRVPVPVIQLVKSSLLFFDEHYQYLAKQRGSKALDGNGKLILYPGSGCETYKMAYNPSSTIAALKAVTDLYLTKVPQDSVIIALRNRIPEIPLTTTADGDSCIAPAITWARIQNVETPQLYPVFPWRLYGVGKAHLDIARNTYLKDPHALSMRSSKGWKQDNIWAACLGLTDEAKRLTLEKFADGPFRFPAFWEAGFDWAPDMNHGGSAMIGLQEMLLQEAPDGSPLLCPAWPQEWPVSFRLHTSSHQPVTFDAALLRDR